MIVWKDTLSRTHAPLFEATDYLTRSDMLTSFRQKFDHAQRIIAQVLAQRVEKGASLVFGGIDDTGEEGCWQPTTW